MVENNEALSHPPETRLACTLESVQPKLYYGIVTVPAKIIDALYHEAALAQQYYVQTHGFGQGQVPLEYIKQNFKADIVEHLKEFLLKFAVINNLYKEIRDAKLLVAGEPRLLRIRLEPGADAHFHFELSTFPALVINEWKYLPFKAPKRKNYKDIDKQVETFVKQEREYLQKTQEHAITQGDWVNFNLSIITHKNPITFRNFQQNFWFKIGDEEIISPIHEIFIERKKGDIFETTNKGLQDYFSNQIRTHYTFCIEIVDVLPYAFFCLDQLKQHFRIKTNKDMHKKLIEVFSYRNDISQRRSMVEESLKLMLSKHRFTVPSSLILRQQKGILQTVQQNPDYNVYRMQKDFQNYVHKLAEKQAHEALFIDQFAYHENIDVLEQDVKSYLNLTKRPRMKEFIYFDLPSFKVEEQEVPIPTEEIKRICLREKAANYIIYHLTKK